MANAQTPGRSPASLLSQIRPTRRPSRFLQTWDPRSETLRYGCGDSEHSVFVTSRGWLTAPKGGAFMPSRLHSATVERFRQGPSQRVDGAELRQRLIDECARYLHFADARTYLLLALWVMGTYVYMMFSYYGYLFLHSRQKRSGKTLGLEVLHHLAFEASVPLNCPTVPAIRDTVASGQTILLDTLERWRSKSQEAYAAAMELLDAGFRNGGTTIKMERDRSDRWVPKSTAVFAPYALAGISRDSLGDTALDRSFAIEMERKRRNVKKARYSYDDCERTCSGLRDDLYLWALQNAEAIWHAYRDPDLDAKLERLHLQDRAFDIWKPLFAIADAIGGPSQAWDDLVAVSVSMGQDDDAADNARQLAVVRAFRQELNGMVPLVGMTGGLEAILAKHGIQAPDLCALLTQWGFAKGSKRGASGPRWVWTLTDSELARIEDQLSQF